MSEAAMKNDFAKASKSLEKTNSSQDCLDRGTGIAYGIGGVGPSNRVSFDLLGPIKIIRHFLRLI